MIQIAKPIIKKIQPFDSNFDYEISISWTGTRAHSNRIFIYDNETNALIFDHTVASYALKHTSAYTHKWEKICYSGIGD